MAGIPGVTPVPVKSIVLEKSGLLTYILSQWLTGLRAAVNRTPGNSTPVLFADLPIGVPGMLQVVTDSTVNTWGTAVVIGGGAFTVTVHWNGTQWTVAAV
jgi:hypothetical protein